VRKLCAISVDLDPIECYYRIHALGEPPLALRDVILRRALPRFGALFQRRGIPATLFVVGRDLDPAGNDAGPAAAQAARAQLGNLARQGHELGNHSYSHPYQMARLDEGRVAEEIRRTHELLAAAGGKAPVGFRAPGYDLSTRMLAELEALGYLYDSSIFPAPLYYTAKLGVMAAMRLMGKKTGAVVTSPKALLAPTDPYRPNSRAPWRRGQSSLVELPIGVTPWLGVPAFGTSLVMAPDRVRADILEQMRARPLYNLECHGIDLIDADSDGIPGGLVAKQPDLKVPLDRKLRSLEATLDRLAPEYDFVTLREVARTVQRGSFAAAG
jgi:hypothetical protein